jgi:hypothetical protein
MFSALASFPSLALRFLNGAAGDRSGSGREPGSYKDSKGSVDAGETGASAPHRRKRGAGTTA